MEEKEREGRKEGPTMSRSNAVPFPLSIREACPIFLSPSARVLKMNKTAPMPRSVASTAR